jgi:hypothetical protein
MADAREHGHEKREVTIQSRDLASAAEKLEKFGREHLSHTEQMVVDWLLQRAASAPVDDPQGDVRAYLSAPHGRPGQHAAFAQRFTQALGYGPGITNPGDLRAVRIEIELSPPAAGTPQQSS